MAQQAARHVRIIMATCNGAPFLRDQLQSIADQTYTDWSLTVGDDGSQDATLDILKTFQRAHPARSVEIRSGPGRGSAANFLTQAQSVAGAGDWVAFADQDDVWLPHKIARAVSMIRDATDATTPVAYCARTRPVGPDMRPRALSAKHARPAHFRNALVQNIMGGNTLVLNPQAAALLSASTRAALDARVPFHDWWIYMLVSGAGGRVLMDDDPVLFYRQHHANSIGHHGGFHGRYTRARLLIDGTYTQWLDRNLDALGRCRPMLTPGARSDLDDFAAQRRLPKARDRLRALDASGIYRQTRLGDAAVRLLARFGRL